MVFLDDQVYDADTCVFSFLVETNSGQDFVSHVLLWYFVYVNNTTDTDGTLTDDGL